jgi:hypothetical protein
MDVVTMGGPVERTIEIHTSALVLECFLTYAHFDVSLQDALAIILKRSQDQKFSAPVEWATFIKQSKAEVAIVEAMVEFAVYTTLEVRRNTRLDVVVSLVSPRVEVQADENWMLPERGQMTSTIGSHGHIERYSGVHAGDYASLAVKSGTDVLHTHPHHPTGKPKGSCGAWYGGILLVVSIEAGNRHDCSIPRVVSYEPGCNDPCVYARTKSYFDTNVEEWSPSATETQGYPSKGAEDEKTARKFKTELNKKELEQCSET